MTQPAATAPPSRVPAVALAVLFAAVFVVAVILAVRALTSPPVIETPGDQSPSPSISAFVAL